MSQLELRARFVVHHVLYNFTVLRVASWPYFVSSIFVCAFPDLARKVGYFRIYQRTRFLNEHPCGVAPLDGSDRKPMLL